MDQENEFEFLEKSGIYAIINIINDKMYIGSAINFKLRKRLHFNELKRNDHINPKLQNAWIKYWPHNFIFVILERCEPINLIQREQWWIDNLKPEYNIAPKAGNQLGYKHTEETKAKMSANHNRSAEAIKNKSISHLGQKRSNEAIAKFKTTRGNKWPHAQVNKCRCSECKFQMNEYKRQWAANNK